jgi:hypothetical protein
MAFVSHIGASMVGFVLGGIFTQTLSGAVTALIGFTGFFGGAAHYAAILAGRSKRDVERATGFGFFFGCALGALVLAIDALT